jgi:voltage-gated potassium channel
LGDVASRRGKLGVPLRVLVFFSVPTALIAAGTLGYHWIEGWSWFYAFYVAVITLTSIGYGEAQPLSNAGRVFTMILALGGISTVAVVATELLGLIITGDLGEFWSRWRMGRRIDGLRQQVIVCGYGDVGRHVCADLLAAGIPVVVVDRHEDPIAAAREAGAHFLLGDATMDTTLSQAGIARARALIAVAAKDAENVLITLSARLLAPGLPIVARVEDGASVPKLLRAGATLTVSPRAVAGDRMADAVLRPSLFQLLGDLHGDGPRDLQLEEQLVRPGSPLDGQTVGSSGLRAGRRLIVVAIKRRDGQLAFNPDDDAPVAAGDTLITVSHGLAFSR